MTTREWRYPADGMIDGPELVKVHQRASKAFATFRPFPDDAPVSITVKGTKALPDPADLDAIEWDHILSIAGNLSPKQADLPFLADILKQCREIVNDHSCGITIGFEEKQSQQSAAKFDRVGIHIREGNFTFAYYPEGSRVRTDFAYRIEFLARAIQVADLPMTLTRQHGQMELKHLPSGEVKIADASHEYSLRGLDCEVPGASLDDMVARLRRFLAELASAKPFAPRWDMGADGHAVCQRLYAEARKFPVKSFDIHAFLKFLRAEGLEQVRPFQSGKKGLFTCIGVFTYPGQKDEVQARLYVNVTKDGHQLSLGLLPPESGLVGGIGKKLGVEFLGQMGKL